MDFAFLEVPRLNLSFKWCSHWCGFFTCRWGRGCWDLCCCRFLFLLWCLYRYLSISLDWWRRGWNGLGTGMAFGSGGGVWVLVVVVAALWARGSLARSSSFSVTSFWRPQRNVHGIGFVVVTSMTTGQKGTSACGDLITIRFIFPNSIQYAIDFQFPAVLTMKPHFILFHLG